MQIQDISRLTSHMLALLDKMTQVNDMQGIARLVVAWHGLLPFGTRALLVVGVAGAARQPTEVLGNVGWPESWPAEYARIRAHRVDPVWNSPPGRLVVWSQALKVERQPGMRAFLRVAAEAELTHGVSWIEQRGQFRIIFSLAGQAVESDPVTAELLASLAPRLADIVARVLSERPVIDDLDARDCSILQFMLHGHGDDEIARSIGISVRTVRARINRIRGVHGARNRVDLVRRLFQLRPEAVTGR
ncbi:hypothetical protein CEK28_04920 [Xenophilus sp. AP218F]|nr:hypothetical protein CEK28_04920 [Xenophilus sp. AP218F]